MFLKFHFLVVLVHIFFSNAKISKMRSKVDANATDVCMGLNNDSKESGETNENEVHNDQHATVPEKNHFTPGSPNDPSSF